MNTYSELTLNYLIRDAIGCMNELQDKHLDFINQNNVSLRKNIKAKVLSISHY